VRPGTTSGRSRAAAPLGVPRRAADPDASEHEPPGSRWPTLAATVRALRARVAVHWATGPERGRHDGGLR
jgi:hypothetical protein